MDTVSTVKGILRAALNLGSRADALSESSALLGGLPEFDSMAVVTVVTMIEDELGIVISDDELSADVFATVGSLAEFVAQKMAA
jgi:acyl carrier protein